MGSKRDRTIAAILILFTGLVFLCIVASVYSIFTYFDYQRNQKIEINRWH